ncbi:MAG: hypothetical protein J5I93_15275, partial [Pirellulaceae bacterium]|nr:hypothetical protein [Pirellulaceae bacterium]
MQDARPCRGPSAIRWFAISAICILSAAPLPARASGPPSLPEMLEDAELCDIRFVDSSQGWAVGDRGVIWHTQDGGQSWQLQDSPVSCRLESICFVDARRGWIVGGWVHPYTHASTGVVLRTEDGGRRWVADSNLTLPALKVVRFLDARRGWAVGHRSAMHRTGVFRTEDGGRSWAAVPGGNSQGWLAGDFRDDRSGAVAGRTGQLSLVAYSQLKPSPGPDLGLRHLHRLRLQGPAGGWLVGDGGLVQQTSDGGLTWQAPPGPLPPGMATEFDFQALEVHGPHCWVAGSPGTRVFHSPDGGQRWEALATGQPLPINSLCFADPQLGWACGPLGTILATRDGGRTWSRQRTGGTRVALLGIFSEAERVPLELLAGTSGEEGYLGWVELLARRDLEIPLDASSPPEERAHRALVSVGASGARSAWRFPLRQQGVGWSAESMVAAWDLFADGQGTHLLEQHIVRRIRQWRPDVVVTETMSPHGNRPLAHLTNQLVLSAVQKAGDPTAFSDQLTLGGLRPWTVQKVFSHARDDETAAVTINPSQLAPRLGQSLADQATHGSSLLRSAYQPTASSHGFRLLLNRLPQDVGRQGIFHGLSLQPGGEARRLATPMPAVNLAELSRRAQRRRNVHQLIDRTQVGSADAAWLSQLDDLTHGLGGSSGGEILYQLAERYRQSGKPLLAADAFERLLAQYPDHPLVEPSLLWLVQFYASQEAGWQLRRANRASTQHLAVQARLQPAVRGEVRPASFEEPLGQAAPPAVPAAVAGRAATVESVA